MSPSSRGLHTHRNHTLASHHVIQAGSCTAGHRHHRPAIRCRLLCPRPYGRTRTQAPVGRSCTRSERRIRPFAQSCTTHWPQVAMSARRAPHSYLWPWLRGAQHNFPVAESAGLEPAAAGCSHPLVRLLFLSLWLTLAAAREGARSPSLTPKAAALRLFGRAVSVPLAPGLASGPLCLVWREHQGENMAACKDDTVWY